MSRFSPFRIARWTRRGLIGSASGRLGRIAARAFLDPEDFTHHHESESKAVRKLNEERDRIEEKEDNE